MADDRVAVDNADDVEKRKRRLRKKLVQIENLEILDRQLNHEEVAKVAKKTELRNLLIRLIQETEMKRNTTEKPGNQSSPDKIPRLDAEKKENSGVQSSDKTLLPTSSKQSNSSRDTDTNLPPVPSSSLHSQKSVKSSDASQKSATPSLEHQKSVNTSARSVPADGLPGPSEAKARSASVNSVDRTKQGGPDRGVECVRVWRKRKWEVEDLEGHEDLILDCDIDIENNVAVTSSRDTTVKVWDLSSGVLIHSLRGHRGPVSGVRLLVWKHSTVPSIGSGDIEERQKDLLDPSLPESQLVCISASSDCTVKVWNLTEGISVSSIYTYNGINNLEIIRSNQISITGTDGGKLEMYSLNSGTQMYSISAHDDAVTALSLNEECEEGGLLASGSADGIIKVFKVLDASLRCIYVSENLCSASVDSSLHTRPVQSISVGESGVIYYGDNGHNLKMLEWRMNRGIKFSNHTSEEGFTDHISRVSNIIIATSYDVDTGYGQLNIYRERDGQIPQYLATLADNNTSRIYVMSAKEKDGSVYLLTGGRHLKVWKSRAASSSGSTVRDISTNVQGCVLTLGDSPVVDSGSEDEEDSEGEVDQVPVGASDQAPSKPDSGFCNCSLM